MIGEQLGETLRLCCCQENAVLSTKFADRERFNEVPSVNHRFTILAVKSSLSVVKQTDRLAARILMLKVKRNIVSAVLCMSKCSSLQKKKNPRHKDFLCKMFLP